MRDWEGREAVWLGICITTVDREGTSEAVGTEDTEKTYDSVSMSCGLY